MLRPWRSQPRDWKGGCVRLLFDTSAGVRHRSSRSRRRRGEERRRRRVERIRGANWYAENFQQPADSSPTINLVPIIFVSDGRVWLARCSSLSSLGDFRFHLFPFDPSFFPPPPGLSSLINADGVRRDAESQPRKPKLPVRREVRSRPADAQKPIIRALSSLICFREGLS